MIGIDEVGRGAWAGPLLVVAARQTKPIDLKLRDSKKTTKLQRQKAFRKLGKYCDFGEGWVSPAEIDSLGLSDAMRLGVDRALSEIKARHNETIIMDGAINYCDDSYQNVQCVVRGDDKFPIVSAASIHAKVNRDDYMADQAKNHVGYGFEKHVGYGTKQHSDALKQRGVCSIHRLSFKPVSLVL